tara:strand:+ start:1930 stop:3522 length:1593 start_codon:yes stop_codon:yes gene_type:complete
MSKFKEFLKNLFKGADTSTGITKSSVAQEKLKDASELFGKFDETTKPGEFKKQKEKIIDPDGNVEAEVFSYRPESFTDMQRRERIGEFSQEALANQYFDNKLDDLMPLSEFEDLRLNQGKSIIDILEDQRMIEDVSDGKIPLPKISKQLAQVEDDLLKESSRVNTELDTVRSRSMEVKAQLEQMGIDTSKVDFDVIANSTDLEKVADEADKLKELMDSMLGGSMSDLAQSGNIESALTSISDEVTADMGRVQEMLMNSKTPAEGEELIKLLYKIKEEGEKAFRTGVYNSPVKTRTLNADGGRIGFKDGSGKLPVTRRTVLQGLAASLAAAFIPFTSKVAKVAPKVVPEMAAQGMPSWFPMLVNKIKTQGEQTRVATGGRNPENVYKIKDGNTEYILTEDAVNGSIDVSTRGDNFQQVSFEYIPPTEMRRPDGKAFTEDAEFYASEFQKGGDDIPDYENTLGGVEDLKLGIQGIEDFATKGAKTSKEKLQEASDKFMRDTTREDTSGFAKGGKVRYNNGGGVGTLFKRKAS